jgi:hypothetical protein
MAASETLALLYFMAILRSVSVSLAAGGRLVWR